VTGNFDSADLRGPARIKHHELTEKLLGILHASATDFGFENKKEIRDNLRESAKKK
jgi:hypothetical protein